MNRTPPGLLRLLEAGRDAVLSGSFGAVAENLQTALATFRQSNALFEFRAVTLPLKGEAEEGIAEARSLFVSQQQALDDVDRAVGSGDRNLLGDAMRRLQDSIRGLQMALSRLAQLEGALPRCSSVPLVDQFVRTARNVEQGFLDPTVLQQRVPLLLGMLGFWRDIAGRFFALHEAPAALSEDFQAAAGRMQTALEEMSAAVLTERLSGQVAALSASTTDILPMLERMEELTRQSHTYSSIPAVEDVHRALSGFASGKQPLQVVESAVRNLLALNTHFGSQAMLAASHPMFFTIHLQWVELTDLLRSAMDKTQSFLETLERNPPGRDASLLALRDSYEAVAASLQRLGDDLRGSESALEGLPLVQELVHLLGLLALRGVSPQYVKERVEHFLKLNRELTAEAHSTEADPTSQQMRLLLQAQHDGLSKMARFLEEPDEEHLREGFQVLRDIHPHMMELHSRLRAAVESSQRPSQVACMRCGNANGPGSRFCSACKAVLPQVAASDEPIYTDITAAGDGTPQNLSRLQNLFALAEQGADLPPIVEELSALLGRLQEVQDEYERNLAPRLVQGNDPLLARYGPILQAYLARFIEGVSAMRHGAQVSDIHVMASGLEVALQAGEYMQQARLEMEMQGTG